MTDTITLPRSVVEQAISTIVELEYSNSTAVSDKMARDSKAALRAALEQPQVEQEPVAWLPRDEACLALWQAMHKRADMGNPTDDKLVLNHLRQQGLWIGKYAHPQPKREPLTVGQINRLIADGKLPLSGNPYEVARAIERAHKIGGEA